MSDRRPLTSAAHIDPVATVCELLELLGAEFTDANLDYEYADSTNRFLILYRGVWHAINFSDTTLMIRRPEELLEEIVKAVNVRAMNVEDPSLKHPS